MTCRCERDADSKRAPGPYIAGGLLVVKQSDPEADLTTFAKATVVRRSFSGGGRSASTC